MQTKDAVSVLLYLIALFAVMIGSFTFAIRGQPSTPLSDRVLIQEEKMRQLTEHEAQRYAEMLRLREEVAILRNSVTEMKTAAYVIGTILSFAISVNIVLQVQVKKGHKPPS